jgi:uncharacterized protein
MLKPWRGEWGAPTLKSAVQNARLGREEELGALRRLDHQALSLEKEVSDLSVGSLIVEERQRSHLYGGRSVVGWEPPGTAPQVWAAE